MVIKQPCEKQQGLFAQWEILCPLFVEQFKTTFVLRFMPLAASTRKIYQDSRIIRVWSVEQQVVHPWQIQRLRQPVEAHCCPPARASLPSSALNRPASPEKNSV